MKNILIQNTRLLTYTVLLHVLKKIKYLKLDTHFKFPNFQLQIYMLSHSKILAGFFTLP
jgi:hypothetical protein